MSMRAKRVIDAASAATANAERCIESAINLLKRDRPRNVFGVYMDRPMVEAEPMAAWRDIRQALEAIDTVSKPWPTPRDLEGV